MSCLGANGAGPGNCVVAVQTILISIIARLPEGRDGIEAELGVPHTFVVNVPKVTNIVVSAIAINIEFIKEAKLNLVTVNCDAPSEELLGDVCGFLLGERHRVQWAVIRSCVKVSDTKFHIKTSLATHTSYKKRIVLMLMSINGK